MLVLDIKQGLSKPYQSSWNTSIRWFVFLFLICFSRTLLPSAGLLSYFDDGNKMFGSWTKRLQQDAEEDFCTKFMRLFIYLPTQHYEKEIFMIYCPQKLAMVLLAVQLCNISGIYFILIVYSCRNFIKNPRQMNMVPILRSCLRNARHLLVVLLVFILHNHLPCLQALHFIIKKSV